MPKSSILVVDDEPFNFDVVDLYLRGLDYNLHYAASGKMALDCLDSYQPDIILLDVMMPEMDGIEVCKHIKSMPKWRTVPVIVVTALSTKDDLARCLEAGADDFISKPVNRIELRARVNSMLRIKRQFDSMDKLAQLQHNTIDQLENALDEHQNQLQGGAEGSR